MMSPAFRTPETPLFTSPLAASMTHGGAAAMTSGSLNGRTVHEPAEHTTHEHAKTLLARTRQIAKDHVVSPLKTAGFYADKGVREVVWAAREVPGALPILALARAVVRIASVITGWLIKVLDVPAAQLKSDEDVLKLVNERTWPTAIRQFLTPVTVILKVAKAVMDWTVSVLETTQRPDWAFDPAAYLDKAVSKYVTFTQDDLKLAAQQTLKLGEDCLIADIAQALSELDEQQKQVFHTALFDRLFDRLQASTVVNDKDLSKAREGLQWLGETFSATPSGKRGMFFQSEKKIANALLGHTTHVKKSMGPEVAASLTIGPTLLWNAIADHSRFEASRF